MPRPRKQNRNRFFDRFVAHRAVDQPDAVGFVKAFEIVGQRPRARRIVRAIQNDFRILGDALQTARPRGRRDALPDGCGCDAKLPQRRDGRARVLHLMLARQRTVHG